MKEGIIIHATEEAKKEYEKNPIKKKIKKTECPACDLSKLAFNKDNIDVCKDNKEINEGDI